MNIIHRFLIYCDSTNPCCVLAQLILEQDTGYLESDVFFVFNNCSIFRKGKTFYHEGKIVLKESKMLNITVLCSDCKSMLNLVKLIYYEGK